MDLEFQLVCGTLVFHNDCKGDRFKKDAGAYLPWRSKKMMAHIFLGDVMLDSTHRNPDKQ